MIEGRVIEGDGANNNEDGRDSDDGDDRGPFCGDDEAEGVVQEERPQGDLCRVWARRVLWTREEASTVQVLQPVRPRQTKGSVCQMRDSAVQGTRKVEVQVRRV